MAVEVARKNKIFPAKYTDCVQIQNCTKDQ